MQRRRVFQENSHQMRQEAANDGKLSTALTVETCGTLYSCHDAQEHIVD